MSTLSEKQEDDRGRGGDYDSQEEDDCYDSDKDELCLNDVEGEAETAKCLFCQHTTCYVPPLFEHMQTAHDFDLDLFKKKYAMDQYSFIKMVNWFRSKEGVDKLTQEMGKLTITEEQPPWEDDKWFAPVMENDVMLTHWLGWDDEEVASDLKGSKAEDVLEKGQMLEDGLQSQIENSPMLQQFVNQLLASQKAMKETVLRFVKESTFSTFDTCATSNNTNGAMSLPEVEYFESYDDLDIHADMLKDLPRTHCYMRVIKNNPGDFTGKSVLDLGCGTGILSMFCVDAGANLVYAVDVSKMIYEAMDICFENNKEKNIKFINKKLELVSAEEAEKVDILVSEFMGYFLLFEGMTNSYLYARDRFLKPGGKMFPSSATMLIAAISDEKKYQEEVQIWDCMHGYKMSTLRKKVLKEAFVKTVNGSSVVSEGVVIKSLDLHTCLPSDLIIDGSFKLEINKDCSLTAICGYFDVGFDDGTLHKETLSTAPDALSTHWKQVLFYLPKMISVVAGQILPIHFTCKPHPEFDRWLSISIKIEDIFCTYDMK